MKYYQNIVYVEKLRNRTYLENLSLLIPLFPVKNSLGNHHAETLYFYFNSVSLTTLILRLHIHMYQARLAHHLHWF